MNKEITETPNVATELSQISTTLKIGENLHKRLEKIITLSKHVDDVGYTKQRWVTEAVREKLEKEEKEGLDNICKERLLTFRLSPKTLKKIEERVSIMKKLHTSYSRKLWLVEAICEKLEEDEQSLKEKLQNKIDSIKNKFN